MNKYKKLSSIIRSTINRDILSTFSMMLFLLTCSLFSWLAYASWPNSTANWQLQFQPCPNLPGIECGQLQVPIDWTNPSGAQLTLGIQRVKTNSTARKGSLLFNPGGPGVPATTICTEAAFIFSPELLSHYDLICPDPRGVGTSTPVKCDPAVWNRNVSITPRNQSEFQDLAKFSSDRGRSCLNMTGDLIKYVNSKSAAYDIEVIRLALGNEILNWLGLSYGSLLGAQYAELFPQNVGLMAFDGVESHSTDFTTSLFIKAATYQNELTQFFAWCASNATRCGFQSNNLAQTWTTLIANATRSPIPAPGCSGNSTGNACRTTVTAQDIMVNTQNLLMWQNTTLGVLPGWAGLGAALNQTVTKNDATAFSSALATSTTDQNFAADAIYCLDHKRYPAANISSPGSFAIYQQFRTMGQAFNPQTSIYSNAYVSDMTCLNWPVNATNPQHVLYQTAVAQLPPILMVNSVHDPFTSYAWAMDMKEQLPSARLVARQGDGHTSYFLRGEASRVIDAYFVNGTLPNDGLVVYS